MFVARSFKRLFLPGVVGLSALCGCHGRSIQLAANPPAPNLPHLQQIHFDQDCQVLADSVDGVQGLDESALENNPVVCHLESVLRSKHIAETIHGNHVARSLVTVWERTYVLQDITEKPVFFVVEQPVPAGWRVDSYPPPVERIGSTAIFRVTGDPGQVVRLHVGERFTRPLPPVSASGPQS